MTRRRRNRRRPAPEAEAVRAIHDREQETGTARHCGELVGVFLEELRKHTPLDVEATQLGELMLHRLLVRWLGPEPKAPRQRGKMPWED